MLALKINSTRKIRPQGCGLCDLWRRLPDALPEAPDALEEPEELPELRLLLRLVRLPSGLRADGASIAAWVPSRL